jgi:hypothetical protein
MEYVRLYQEERTDQGWAVVNLRTGSVEFLFADQTTAINQALELNDSVNYGQ